MSSCLSTSRQNQLRLRLLTLNDFELPSISPPCTPIAKTPTPVFRKGPNDARIYQPDGHPKQCVIDGEIWPPVFVPENVRSAKAMKPRSDDIFICTYPKCGTTWLQHIVHQLMRESNYQAGEGKEMCFQSPMIERMGGKFSETIECPRILKTHFNFMNVPKSCEAKYIFCVRNPKDCLTSYYHHNRNFKIYNFANGGFDSFFELFISGQLAFGDYFDHLIGWLPYINNHNVLFLSYEEMCRDLHSAVYRIGQFLGGRAAQLVECANELENVVENSKIGAMKKEQNRWFPENILHQDNFIRKGGSRDWKNYLSKEQSDRLDTVFQTRCAGTVAANWWKEEMIWDLMCLQPTQIHIEADNEECNMDDEEGVDESVSRRNSFSKQDRFTTKEHITVSEHPHMVRRASVNSLSTGYGSVW